MKKKRMFIQTEYLLHYKVHHKKKKEKKSTRAVYIIELSIVQELSTSVTSPKSVEKLARPAALQDNLCGASNRIDQPRKPLELDPPGL